MPDSYLRAAALDGRDEPGHDGWGLADAIGTNCPGSNS